MFIVTRRRKTVMARVNEGFTQFYLPPTHLSTSGMSHICLYSPVAERHCTLAGTHFSSHLDPVVDRVKRNDRLGCFVDRLDRLGRLAATLIIAFCSCLLTAWQLTQKKFVSKHLMPSQFQVEGLRTGLAFLLSFHPLIFS